MSVELVDNVGKFGNRFDQLEEKARYLLSSQILADANKHVRADKWRLRDSSLQYSIPKDGYLIWNTPYAKRVYYTGTPSTDQNPDAELMWVHVARDRYSEDWMVMFKNLAEKEILK